MRLLSKLNGMNHRLVGAIVPMLHHSGRMFWLGVNWSWEQDCKLELWGSFQSVLKQVELAWKSLEIIVGKFSMRIPKMPYLDVQHATDSADELLQYWQVFLPVLMSHLKTAVSPIAAEKDARTTATGLALLQAIQHVLDTREFMTSTDTADLVSYVRDNGNLWLPIHHLLNHHSFSQLHMYAIL